MVPGEENIQALRFLNIELSFNFVYLDFDSVKRISQSLSLDLLSDFLRLELTTFSKIASLDLERYRFRSVFLSLHV